MTEVTCVICGISADIKEDYITTCEECERDFCADCIILHDEYD